jgi:type IV secretion system protein VirB3
MSREVGRIGVDSLFLGLTRPTMVFGITYQWLMVEGLGALLWFINSPQKGYAFLIGGIMHIVGILLFAKEPRILEILSTWGRSSTKCVNRRYHSNTSSYDVY